MSIKKSIKTLIISSAFLVLPLAVFAQIPQLPHVFYGDITINGSSALVGTVIIAELGGVEKGRITTSEVGKYGGPGAYDLKLLVQGDDLQTGNIISFTVSGVGASQTAQFESGKVEVKNLEFTQEIILPIASVSAGTYTSVQSVVLSAPGASSIHYTTDGSTPTCSTGMVYSGAISVGSSQTIKAISCYLNSVSSAVASFSYTINIPATTSGGGGGSSYTPPALSPLSAEAQKVDANKDGKIDILDFNTLMVNWGSTLSGNIADFDNDGKVDIFDFNLLMIHWTE